MKTVKSKRIGPKGVTLGKPEGTKEKEIRIAILLLGQRPPRYAGVGRSCSIADAISWGMRVWDFMLARSDTGAGQPVPLISTRMAVILTKMRSRRGLSAARKRERWTKNLNPRSRRPPATSLRVCEREKLGLYERVPRGDKGGERRWFVLKERRVGFQKPRWGVRVRSPANVYYFK